MSQHISQQQQQMQTSSFQNEPPLDVLVRKADLDDCDDLNVLIEEEGEEAMKLLYFYPKILTLFEHSYLSVTVLDQQSNIIGCAVFNDSPQGVNGMVDFKHENFWEHWLSKVWEVSDEEITPYNTLWMTYLFLAKKKYKLSVDQQLNIISKIFQNVYGTLDGVTGILFLRRAESIQSGIHQAELEMALQELFFQIEQRPDVSSLRNVEGITPLSEIYYSPSSQVMPLLTIRMAREEDHDDLAAIFNRQSDVHTEEFGEFFIADMIATQNQTRRQARKFKSDGKAIVGQVDDKAIGLMSISTEIDYRLLGNCFELDTFDYLYKSNYMDAIRKKFNILEKERLVNSEVSLYKKQLLLRQESLKCHIIGQRLYLQQFCLDKEQEIKIVIDNLLTSAEDTKNNLTKEYVIKMIEEWLQGYQIFVPSQLFMEFPDECLKQECLIQKPRDILLETLEFFGLPKNYINGEGHWKDWQKKILEERKAASLRKPKKQSKATQRKKPQKAEDKKEDELQPPSYFDLQPFLQAFTKFTAVSAEQRTQFRRIVDQAKKKVIMLFCHEDGEMNPTRHVDLIQFGELLRSQGLDVPIPLSENLTAIMECFGQLECDEKIIQVIKEEKEQKQKGKEAPLKKVGDQNEQPKPVDVLQKMTSYPEFMNSLQLIKEYDQMMCRLGLIKSHTLNQEVSENIEKEEEKLQRIQKKLEVNNEEPNEWDDFVKNVTMMENLPEAPKTAANAIVINLFCIDELYESRSLDFVEYAFSLFPDRDYIILTQPYTVQETTLLQHFIQVPRKKNSTFEHVLYIFHRDSLAANLLRVRQSQPEDVENIMSLLETLTNREDVIKDINQAISKKAMLQCFSVFCDSQIIGMYVMSKYVNLPYLTSHFCIQDHILLKEHPQHLHTKLLHAVLNPLFVKQTRFILREISRLMGKTCIFFEVHNRTLLPDIFNEFVFVRPRAFPHFLKRPWDFNLEQEQIERRGELVGIDGGRDPMDQEESPFSLSMLTKKQLSAVKVSNNTRIVVVGASDTGISFIESLLTIKDINFTNIILLAPGGLQCMHAKDEFDFLKGQSGNYTLEELKGLMIDARVTVIDAKMVKLDKKNNYIEIDKNAKVPFDILIITVGLIDTELQNRPLVSFGVAQSPYYKDKKYINGVYSIDDPYLYQHFARNNGKGSNVDQLIRKKKPQNITIYGNTLHTICLISGLINRGVKPERIYYVMPPKTYKKQTNFKSNTERLEYEDKLVNDPDQFENELVEQIVFERLEQLGVHVNRGFTLFDIQTASEGFGAKSNEVLNKVVFRKKADDYEEIQAQIEQKKQEILERMQNSENNQSKNQDIIDYEREDGEEGVENIENTLEKDVERLEAQLFVYLPIDSRFFVTSGLIDIDKEIFNIIHENGLVYNGRLIVKSNFQTTQNNIFACGKICEFSQRYKYHSIGKSLRLDKYNGRELGQKLSKCILDQLELSYLTSQTYSVEELPQLYMPIGYSGIVPHKLYYYHFKRNEHAKPKQLLLSEKEKDVICSNNFQKGSGHFLQFNFDLNGLVESVTYLGSEAVHSPSLIQFIDLSSKYLNKLTHRFSSGLIPNVSEFLSENWAIALYHEWFSEFRHITKTEMLKHELIEQVLEKAQQYARDGNYFDENFYEEIKKLITHDIIDAIQDGTIEFIRENQNHLPMYFLPEKKLKQ